MVNPGPLRRPLLAADRWWFARRLDIAVRARSHMPVIVFQMGKVGSSSIAASFPTRSHPIGAQVHRLDPDQIRAAMNEADAAGFPVRRHQHHALVLAQQVIDAGYPYKVITPVREPISRAISYMFQAFELFVGAPVSAAHTTEDLRATLLDRQADLVRPAWFRRQYEPALGLDVFSHPFDTAAGWQRLPTGRGRGEVLLLQSELDDRVKEQVIGDFLDDPAFRLRSANTAETKDYADLYGRFTREVRFAPDWVDDILGGEYASHFYSAADRERARVRWAESGPSPA